MTRTPSLRMARISALRLTGALLMLFGALLVGLAGWTLLQDSLLPPPLPSAPRDPALAAAAQSAAAPLLLLPDNDAAAALAPDPATPTSSPATPTPAAAALVAPQATPTPDDDDLPSRRLLAPRPTPTASPQPPAPAAAVSAPTHLRIPSIGVDTQVMPVGWRTVTRNGQTSLEWEVADYAAGWHENSALPGRMGNVVLSGHNNIKGMVFRRLADIAVGDAIAIEAGGQVYSYEVVDRFIVKEKGEPLAVRQSNARWIGPFADARLTLVSCWPFTSNTHRVIVIAMPMPK